MSLWPLCDFFLSLVSFFFFLIIYLYINFLWGPENNIPQALSTAADTGDSWTHHWVRLRIILARQHFTLSQFQLIIFRKFTSHFSWYLWIVLIFTFFSFLKSNVTGLLTFCSWFRSLYLSYVLTIFSWNF